MMPLKTTSVHLPMLRLRAPIMRADPTIGPQSLPKAAASQALNQSSVQRPGESLVLGEKSVQDILDERTGGGGAAAGLLAIGVGVVAIGLVLLGVQMYAGQKLGRRFKGRTPDGSSWGWFWAGLGGLPGAGLLGAYHSGPTLGQGLENLKDAL